MAYLVYPSVGTTPLGIDIQELDADGALRGTPKDYDLPAPTTTIDAIAAAYRDNRLGLLFHTTREAESLHTTEFAVTDLSGTEGAPPMLLNSLDTHNKYPDTAYTFFLQPLPSNHWLTVVYTGSGPRWRGYVATPTSVPSTPPLEDDLEDGPWAVAGTTFVTSTPQAAAIVDDTLFVTGYDCEWNDTPACEPLLVFSRYDVETLASRGGEYTTLSTTSYPMTDGRQAAVAIGRLGDRLAALWTQYSPSGALLLGRALFEKSGAIATVRTVEPSNLVPKALIESPSGGALLIASRVEGARHTVVAQRLDDELGFVGAAHALSSEGTDEPTQFNVALNGDGRALLTFRLGYAQHRILHADLCQK